MKFIRINWDLQAFILSVLVFQSHCTCMIHVSTTSVLNAKQDWCFFLELIPQFIFLHFIFWKKSQVRFTLHQSPLFILSGANKISEICKDFCAFHDVTFSCGENSAWLKSMFVPSDIKWNSDTTLSRCTTWCIVPC